MSDSKNKVKTTISFNDFIQMNRTLLECYAGIHPVEYKLLDAPTQKDFCYNERVRLEEVLIKGKISASDFLNASK